MADSKFGYLVAETIDGSVSALISKLKVPNGTLQLSDAEAAELTTGTAQDFALSSFADFSAAVTAAAATSGTLVVNSAATVSSNLTVPANVTLQVTRKGLITVNSSITLTVLGPVEAPEVQIFAGAGAVSWAGNIRQGFHLGAWWGIVGDDSTDCTAIFQKIFDQCDADNFSMYLILPLGKIRIAGALQDTSLSNSQIVLPKRTGDQLSIRIIGRGAPTSLVGIAGAGGTILKSTLASGTGAMIGCKTSDVFFGRSRLNVWFSDLSFETVANPTITALDMRFIMRLFMRDFRIWTGQAGGWTEPTTSTSFGVRTPTNNVVSECRLVNGVVSGFYNGLEVNELSYLNNIQEGPSIYSYTFPESIHPILCGRIGTFFSLHGLRFTGKASVFIAQYDVERAAELSQWYSADQHVNDFSESTVGFAYGQVWFLLSDSLASPPGPSNDFKFGGTGEQGTNIKFVSLFSNSHVYNHVDAYSGIRTANLDIFEINPKRATSGESDFAALIMGAQQSGTANTTAALMFVNSALAVAQKRIAQIGVGTDGATDSGLMNFTTWNAGTSGLRMSITKDGVYIFGLPTHADEAAAVTAGLATGRLYKSSDGVVRVKL